MTTANNANNTGLMYSVDGLNETLTRISHQREVADKVLRALARLNPSAILAGGAPRNWMRTLEANDLDFYIHYNLVGSYATVVRQMVQRELPDIQEGQVQTGDNIPTHYRHNPSLMTVLNYVLEGERIQIMIMNEPTYQLLQDHFPVGSSKFYYSHGGFGSLSCEAFLFSEHKIQIVKDDYYDTIRTNPYMRKVLEQFPESEGYVYIRKSAYEATLNRLDIWERNQIHTILRLEAAPLPPEVPVEVVDNMFDFQPDGSTISLDFASDDEPFLLF